MLLCLFAISYSVIRYYFLFPGVEKGEALLVRGVNPPVGLHRGVLGDDRLARASRHQPDVLGAFAKLSSEATVLAQGDLHGSKDW